MCIHQGRVLDDNRRPRNYSEQQFLRSEDEMLALFSDIPEALANTVEIAKRCNLELSLGENYLTIESMTAVDCNHPCVHSAAEAFGLELDMLVCGKAKQGWQKFGKITRCDESFRREMIATLTDEFNIYSFGLHIFFP